MVNYTLTLQPFKFVWALLDAVYNIDPITRACYTTFKEVFLGLYIRVMQLQPSAFINNVIFKFGDIFDSVRDILLYVLNDSRGNFALPSDAGLALGNAIYLLLLPGP